LTQSDDLLGFSARLEEAGWTLEGPSATLLVKRLHNLYVSLTQFGSPHEQLALNDGVIATFSPDLYEEDSGSRHDLVMWLQHCLQVHCVTTGLEYDFQLPGLRTIICEGQIIVHRTGADPFGRDYPGHMYPLSTQLNTAFAKCFLADQAGSRAGLKRGSVETANPNSLTTSQEPFARSSNKMGGRRTKSKPGEVNHVRLLS
jgi:hypothetical protein